VLLDQQSGFVDLSKIFTSLSPEQCSEGHDLVVSLNNAFQLGHQQVSVDFKTQPLEPFEEIFEFSEIVHSRLDCSVPTCNVHACHRAMLKLGKYKSELDNYDSWHLCVLLASSTPQQHWCETAMYRSKVQRYVELIEWV
jgi:hypothetical protein